MDMKRRVWVILGLCIGLASACDIDLGGFDGGGDDDDDASETEGKGGDDDDDSAETEGETEAGDGGGTAGGGADGADETGSGAADGADGAGPGGESGADGDTDPGFPDEPGVCEAQTSDCDACLDCASVETCGPALDACVGDLSCIELVGCYSDCGEDPTCQAACDGSWPEGLGAFEAMMDCLESSCGNLCAA